MPPTLEPAVEQPGLVHDGNYRVWFCTTIVDMANPTVAEITAGMRLEGQLTKKGLDRGLDDSMVDTSRLSSTFESDRIGTTKPKLSIELVRLDETVMGVVDTAYTTLVKRTLGYLVVRDNLASETALAAGQKVEVYRVECGTRTKAAAAANEQQTFTVPLATPRAPVLSATVAA